MNQVIKWGLIGGGAFWLYSKYADGSLFASSTSTSTTTTPVTTAAPVPVTVPQVVPVSTNPVRAQMIAQANALAPTVPGVQGTGDGILYNIDQWNYVFKMVSGKDRENPANNNLLVGAFQNAGVPGNAAVNVDQYLNALAATGLGSLPAHFAIHGRGMGGLSLGSLTLNNLRGASYVRG